MVYTGIGSRETPPNILSFMNKLGHEFAKNNHILRSGGARGADSAFIQGAMKSKTQHSAEIYVASEKDGGKWKDRTNLIISNIPDNAFNIAEKYHPNYKNLSGYVKRLMARNVMQIFGKALDNPTNFVICYTHDGKDSGGTGQAIRIAWDYNIPVLNLSNINDYRELKKCID